MRTRKIVAAVAHVSLLGGGSALLAANGMGCGADTQKSMMTKEKMGCDGSGMNMTGDSQKATKMGCSSDKGSTKKGCGMHDKGEKGMHGMMGSSMKELMYALNAIDLTTEQQKEIDKLKIDMKYAKMEMKKDEKTPFQEALSEKGFDKDAFEKAVTKKMTEQAKMKAEHIAKVFKILTKEQIKEINEHLN